MIVEEKIEQYMYENNINYNITIKKTQEICLKLILIEFVGALIVF
jgi:hypothetical protein